MNNFHDEDVRMAKIYNMVDKRHSEFASPTSATGLIFSVLVAIGAVAIMFVIINSIYGTI